MGDISQSLYTAWRKNSGLYPNIATPGKEMGVTMVSVVNGSSERAAFLFGGDRWYVLWLSSQACFSVVSFPVDRGARYTVHYLTRGVGILLCYISSSV